MRFKQRVALGVFFNYSIKPSDDDLDSFKITVIIISSHTRKIKRETISF